MRFLLALLFVGFLGHAKAQTQIVLLHPDGVETNEPCIAIDPKYPAIELLGSNVNFVFTSIDAGQTWSPVRTDPKEGFYGDPVVFISQSGTQYICHLSKNKDKKWPEHFDRIVLERSVDGGKTFGSTGVGFHEGKVQDKPWFCLDEGKRSRFENRLYLSWTEFDKYGSTAATDSSRIWVAYSTNDGVGFDTAVTISDQCGDAADNDNTLEGATLATGPKGEVYAVWAGGAKIWFDMSLDGGKSWGKDRVIATQSGGWHNAPPGLMRGNSMPFIKADKKGRLYVIYGDDRNGDQDIFYLYSKDGGKTWTAPIRVNDDPLKNGRDQYMPNICLDRKKNKIYAVFYDRRHSTLNRYTDVYAAELNKDKPSRNLRVTNQSFCAPGKNVFFGDYISVASARGVVRCAFTSFESEGNFATVKVALLSSKELQKPMNNKAQFIELLQLGDTDQIYIHFRVPDASSCTVELTRGSQLYYKQLFEGYKLEVEDEVMLPASRFVSGVYHLTLSSKGRKLERDIFLERR